MGSFRGPGLATADLNVAKRFALTERMNFELLAQFINVTNTPILGRPTFFQGPTFGPISYSNPRPQIQFGFKFHYCRLPNPPHQPYPPIHLSPTLPHSTIL